MQVCCRACGDILTYEKNDTNPLVRHIRAKHPEKNLVCLPAVYSDKDARNSKDKGNKGKSTRKKKNGDQNDPEADTDDLQKKPSNLNFIGTKYKYTVKYYGHSKKQIKCPQCNKEMFPVLKQKQKRMLPSLIRAFFYLICWPINFLPFLLCGRNEYQLFCPECQKKIGTQDKSGKVVLTNDDDDNNREKEEEETKEEKEEEKEEEEEEQEEDEDEGGGGGAGGDNEEEKEEEEEMQKEPEERKSSMAEKEEKKEERERKRSRFEDDDDDDDEDDDGAGSGDKPKDRMTSRGLKEKERRMKEKEREKVKERRMVEKGMKEKETHRKGKTNARHKGKFDSSQSSVPLGKVLGRRSGKLLR